MKSAQVLGERHPLADGEPRRRFVQEEGATAEGWKGEGRLQRVKKAAQEVEFSKLPQIKRGTSTQLYGD